MEVTELINDLRLVLIHQRERTRVIEQLPAANLLYRSTPGAWNVLEVFEHLNLSSGVYLRGLEDVFARKADRYPANADFRPGWLGNWFTQGMRPKPDGDINWRMRTMKMFDPARQQGASKESMDRFIVLCDGFLALLMKAPTTDLNAMRVTSSLGPIIRFKAGDAFRFPVAHQQRHFLQIERSLQQAEQG